MRASDMRSVSDPKIEFLDSDWK